MIQETNDPKTATLFICGDIFNKTKEDGLICSEELSKVISLADCSICNFESPIEGFGKPQPKPGTHLNQKKTTVSGLKKQGFDLLMLANNHMLDYGKEALAATLLEAKENRLETIGAGLNAEDAYSPLIKEINGLSIGMLNACEAQYGEIGIDEDKAGYAWIQHPTFEMNIIKLKQQCDFVLVFAHAGLEHYPIPQKEWRAKYKHFCDLGADVVIGSHPHVPQGVEKHGKSIIFYSLGNFYFDTSNKENNSFAVNLHLRKGDKPSFDFIQHYTKEGLVKLAPKDKWVNIVELNAMLEPEKYWRLHEKMTEEIFKKIRRGIAISIFLPVPLNGSFKDFLKMFVSLILRRSKIKYKDLYQLHLLKNETYLFVIKNALAQINDKRYS
jgi:poly-gamma-glutamate synthesis protein (capsule biosynthesis protein)